MSHPSHNKRPRTDDDGNHTPPKRVKLSDKPKRRKLAPSRPFPVVPSSVSATGPRSAHKEGKNRICVTRKTTLGAYMRRCKDLIVGDGHKTLYLTAMGAAVPHLVQLSLALPPILPHSTDDITTEIITGTQQVHDEIEPADEEEEDVSVQSRSKSTLMVILRIEGGDDRPRRKQVIIPEPEQMDVD